MLRFRRSCAIIMLLTLLLCLCAPALAWDATDFPELTLDEILEQFRADYGLNAQNFSICYYDTVSGESYRWNEQTFMIAASTFKLPLNLYYYELEQAGELSPDSYIGGVPLSDCHYQSLVWSNNDLSIAMLYRLGSFRTYKEKMCKYFTMEDSEIDAIYYGDNYYCTAMMIDTLQYLFEHQDQFEEMIDYLKQAQPDQYFKRYVDTYDIAHKYGYFADSDKGVTAVNDTGIVFTPRPFLLTVYTSNVSGGEEVVARACELLTEYNLWQHEASVWADEEAEQAARQAEQDAQQAANILDTPTDSIDTVTSPEGLDLAPATTSEQEPVPAVPEEPQETDDSPEQIAKANRWWMILVAAVIFLVADLFAMLALRKGVRMPQSGRRKNRRK